MRGILQGLGLTLSHLTRPKVTRLYPYEKRVLSDRSRGLIQLIQDPTEDTPFNLKCEACLLCEKACPPRCITIEYRPIKGANHFFNEHLEELNERLDDYLDRVLPAPKLKAAAR